MVPLPADLQSRLAPPLSDVSKAIGLYLRSAAMALRQGAGAPPIRPVHVALRRYAVEVAALRAAEVARFEAAVASANLPRVIVP